MQVKAGLKYCDFCGTKVEDEVQVAAPAKKQAHGVALGTLVWVVFLCLAIGILVYVGKGLREQRTPPVPPPISLDDKRQAAEACEAGIRKQVRAPFRVIAFRSSLVAEVQEGYAISGSVELQSVVGEVQRKRYFCRVHRDVRAGMVLDECRLE